MLLYLNISHKGKGKINHILRNIPVCLQPSTVEIRLSLSANVEGCSMVDSEISDAVVETLQPVKIYLL